MWDYYENEYVTNFKESKQYNRNVKFKKTDEVSVMKQQFGLKQF